MRIKVRPQTKRGVMHLLMIALRPPLLLSLLWGAAYGSSPVHSGTEESGGHPARAPPIFNVFAFGARGDGLHNDTKAVQAALSAAAKAGGGVAWLPANGTYLFGGGVYAFGHSFDGVTLRLDGRVTVPKPTPNAAGVWPQCAPGWGGAVNGTFPVCYLIEVYNVDGFTLTSRAGPASLSGFLYDEHKNPRPPAGMYALNCTNFLWENVGFRHVSGAVFIHNTQHVMIRNMSINNRGMPIEENGDLEVGGVGSHGEPCECPPGA